MKYKSLILDLDGTTVPSRQDGMPSQKVLEAVRSAQKKGVKVCIATGRSLFYCHEVLKVLSIDQPCVVDAGTKVIDHVNGKILHHRSLKPEKLQEIVRLCAPFGYPLLVGTMSVGNIYGSNKEVTSVSQITEDSSKVFIGTVSKDDAIKISEELEAIDDIAVHLTTSWASESVVDMQITHIEGTKKHSVEKLLKLINVSKQEAIGIGDYHNDIPLLAAVGYKVVMGNAPKEVKAIADFVTGDIDEDGVAQAIDKLILSA